MSFEKAITFTLQWEGGYVNDPKDPGGETKYGISKRAHPNLDIKSLTLDQAGEIYKQQYWDGLCDSLTEPLDMVVFDTAVNCGVSRARLWLSLTDDIDMFIGLRIAHYDKLVKRLPKFERFYRGWMNRVNALKRVIGR